MINEKVVENNETECIDGNKAMDSVKEEINRILLESPSLIRKYIGFMTASKGKYIRAASLLACAENNEGLVHPNAINFASSVEILHLATLIHDDIIDNASIRRGQITLQKKYGQRTAVICGDYLMCMALKNASSVSNKEDYLKLNIPDYLTRVCLGELKQHIYLGFLDLSFRQYMKVISGKTAALFEASFYAGAVLSQSNEKVTKEYKRLGRYIGMIFQMKDDCIDFEMTSDMAKKPVQSDFEQGVITLPLIYAFKNISGFKEKAKNIISRSEINDAVAKSGGLTYTHKVAEKYYNKANTIIDSLESNNIKKAKLKAILDKAYGIS